MSYSLDRYLQDSSSPPQQVVHPAPIHSAAGPRTKMSRNMVSPTRTSFANNGGMGTLIAGKSGSARPKVLLMGQRRSGKSSISSVVFHKLAPTDTLFLESTTRITKEPIHTFMDFQVWETPGQIEYVDSNFDVEGIFCDAGALIWVIDAQDEYLDSLSRLHNTITAVLPVYPFINVEVFIHKVDGLSDDYKLDTQRDIFQRTQDELADHGLDNVSVSYHLTSIFDHSIFEAFSKVIQKLIPQLGTLENLLNVLCQNTGIEKAFLFDVLSKIYIATDSSPVDVQSYEICSDFIDVIVDITDIYGYDRKFSEQEQAKVPPSTADSDASGAGGAENSPPEAASLIRLQNGMVLYLREINKYLALICMMRKEAIEKQGLVEFNVQVFQEALAKVLELRG